MFFVYDTINGTEVSSTRYESEVHFKHMNNQADFTEYELENWTLEDEDDNTESVALSEIY